VSYEDDLVVYARWWSNPEEPYVRRHEHVAVRETLGRLDSAEAAIERVNALLQDEDRHLIRMDGNWVKWSDIEDALDGPS
jgi:hypothetical protein